MSDLIMCVGQKHYPWPTDFAEEAKRIGISKRIAETAVPYIDPGRTRMALIHPRAIVRITAENMTLFDLACELVTDYWPEPVLSEDDLWSLVKEAFLSEDGQSTSGLTYYLREADRKNDLKRLEEKYGIEYHPGIFGWSHVTGIQYVCHDNEHELPEDLRGIEGIEAVRVEYEAA